MSDGAQSLQAAMFQHPRIAIKPVAAGLGRTL